MSYSDSYCVFAYFVHAVSRIEGQLLDELSMIYASCVFMFCVVEEDMSRGRSGVWLTFLWFFVFD